jgi:hypothetical protein
MMELRRPGCPHRLLAGRPAEGGLGLLAQIEHLVARNAMWATKLVEGLCPPALHGPGHPRPPLSPEPEELSGGVRFMADQPVRNATQATSASADPPSPVPGWVRMARVLRACPSLHPLQTLLRATFCAIEAVVPGLLPVARDQRMLVPLGVLRRMMLAISCLGHKQQRPGG